MTTATQLTGSEGWSAYLDRGTPVLMRRDVIEAVGPDTTKFLHALLSQDVAAMADGETRWSFLLQPQGKLVAHFRVHRITGDRFVLDIEAGAGALLHAALKRYLIRTKCALTLEESVPMLRYHREAPTGGGERTVPAHPLLDAVDVFDPHVPTTVVDPSIGEVRRIAVGLPAHGSELDDATIPHATGLVGHAVNFRKGCYVGQELVERMDSRAGSAPTRLVRFAVVGPDEGPLPSVPVRLGDGTHTLGTVTSIATDPRTGERIALGFVARSVEEGERLCSVDTTGGPLLCVTVLDTVDSGGR